ncbi:MAG: ATP-binding cassette domain-containing protein [Magnetococcales bacterium]|nr:ATP-binding cassette domain-containing protein [Magnetococcales bacterium]
MARLVVESVTTVLGFPLSLTVEPGECLGLSGASGSGKSLFLRALADLDPHQGKVCLGEMECANTAPDQWRRLVGLLPAESAWWGAQVQDHFDPSPACLFLFEQLGFSATTLTQPVQQLSSGERQRLAIIRTLSVNPRALLLDEPTANLDKTSAERVEKLIAHYRETQQIPVIWVSHDPQQIKRVAHQHWHLQNGRLQRAQPTDQRG